MKHHPRVRKFSCIEHQSLKTKARRGVLGAEIILYAAEMIKETDNIDYVQLALEFNCDERTISRNIQKFNEHGCSTIRNSGRPRKRRKTNHLERK